MRVPRVLWAVAECMLEQTFVKMWLELGSVAAGSIKKKVAAATSSTSRSLDHWDIKYEFGQTCVSAPQSSSTSCTQLLKRDNAGLQNYSFALFLYCSIAAPWCYNRGDERRVKCLNSGHARLGFFQGLGCAWFPDKYYNAMILYCCISLVLGSTHPCDNHFK